MADPGERGGGDEPTRAERDAEFLAWSATQPIRFGLVDGRRVRLGEEHQGDGRLALARVIAERAFGSAAEAEAWLTSPARDLGGLSPVDLIVESDQGSRVALLALVRLHRGMLAAGDG